MKEASQYQEGNRAKKASQSRLGNRRRKTINGEKTMTELEELIEYWKSRLLEHPPMTSRNWGETVRATIAYLERLNDLWKEK